MLKSLSEREKGERALERGGMRKMLRGVMIEEKEKSWQEDGIVLVLLRFGIT